MTNINATIEGAQPIITTIEGSQPIIADIKGGQFTNTASWGSITGILSNQHDLQTALNLKYDSANFNDDFDTRLETKTTTDLIEGNNLYYTEERVSANSDVSANTAYRNIGHIPLTEKAANNGVATLDSGGKVPSSQLPSSVMDYKGSWDVSTNTPALADGTGNAGDVYLCSTSGTINLGSGDITWSAGDWAVYNGSTWEQSLNSDKVLSVNTQTGVVTLNTDNIPEGSSNLYYTDARAVDAVATADTYLKNTGDTATGDYTFNTSDLHIDSTNNRVGIGTTGPSYPLDVVGSIGIGGATGSRQLQLYGRDSGASNAIIAYYAAANNPLRIATTINNNNIELKPDGTGDVLITNGNVGIGTTNPGALLSLNSSNPILRFDSSGQNPGMEFYKGGILNGMVKGGANQLKFYGGSDTATEDMVVDSSGKVGIGTTSPKQLLSLGDTSSVISTDTSDGSDNKQLIIAGGGDGSDSRAGYVYLRGNEFSSNPGDVNIGAGNVGNAEITFNTGGVTRATIQHGGNVGIGTTTPSSKLQVNGEVYVNSNNFKINYGSYTGGWGRGLLIQNSDGSDNYGFMGDYASDTIKYLRIGKYNDDGKSLYWTPNGNVGIGTTSPLGTLHIKSGDSGSTTARALADELVVEGGANTGINILSPNDAINTIAFGDSDDNEKAWIKYYHDIDEMGIGSNNAERIRINKDGYVGIGISDPDDPLEIRTNEVNRALKITTAGDTNEGAFWISPNSVTSNTPVWKIETGANEYIDLSPEGVQTMYLKEGNVGIGTVSPSQKLDVNGSINIADGSAYLYNGQQALKLTKGTDNWYTNTFVGAGAGNSTAYRQTAIGHYAGHQNIGNSQTALGYYTGVSNTGNQQTALGYYSGYQNSGDYQTALGSYAGYQNSGNYQTALGYKTGYKNTGSRVTGLGYYATRENTANDVVAIGYQAGYQNTVANQFIVKQANVNSVPLIQGDFASGKVGIGTTSPEYKLDVNGKINIKGSGTTPGLRIVTNEGGGLTLNANGMDANPVWDFGVNSNEQFSWSVATQEKMRIDSDGNVGIGTTNPDDGKLTILKNSAYSGFDTAGLSIQSNANDAFTELLIGADDSIDSAYIQSAGKGTSFTTKSLLLNPNGGNVGIGTTSPSSPLTVSKVGSGITSMLYLQTTGGSTYPAIDFDAYGRGYAMSRIVGSEGGSVGAGVLKFETRPSATGDLTTQMILNENGYVGIGTNSPGYTLDVDGTAQLGQGALVAGGQNELWSQPEVDGEATLYVNHRGYNSGYTQPRNFRIDNGKGENILFADGTNNYVGIGTITPQQTLNVKGNVNIGDTPTSALFGINSALVISDSGVSTTRGVLFYAPDGTHNPRASIKQVTASDFSTQDVYFSSDYSSSSTIANWIFQNGNVGIGTTSPSNLLDLDDGNGASGNLYIGMNGRAWFGFQSGIQRMTTTKTIGLYTGSSQQLGLFIDGSQNVGIGTAAPDAKLDINGDKFIVENAKTPSSSTDTGTAGTICWDNDYIYVCVATNTWKRSALSSW